MDFGITSGVLAQASEFITVDLRILNGRAVNPLTGAPGADFKFSAAAYQDQLKVVQIEVLDSKALKATAKEPIIAEAELPDALLTLKDVDGSFVMQDMPLSRLRQLYGGRFQRLPIISPVHLDWRQCYVVPLTSVLFRIVPIRIYYAAP